MYHAKISQSRYGRHKVTLGQLHVEDVMLADVRLHCLEGGGGGVVRLRIGYVKFGHEDFCTQGIKTKRLRQISL